LSHPSFCTHLVQRCLTRLDDTKCSEKYLKHFRKEQLLLLLTEELFAGTIDMMNRIQGFLGLPFFDYE